MCRVVLYRHQLHGVRGWAGMVQSCPDEFHILDGCHSTDRHSWHRGAQPRHTMHGQRRWRLHGPDLFECWLVDGLRRQLDSFDRVERAADALARLDQLQPLQRIAYGTKCPPSAMLWGAVPKPPRSISQYAFTEMLNNAIELSRGSEIEVPFEGTEDWLTFAITDDGVGAVRSRICASCLESRCKSCQRARSRPCPRDTPGKECSSHPRQFASLKCRAAGYDGSSTTSAAIWLWGILTPRPRLKQWPCPHP
jgi:hypothetical protein